MFGSRKVVIYERPSAAEVFGTILTILILGAIVVCFAAWLSWWILIAFLGVGVFIGLVYALIVYIRALFHAMGNLGSYVPRSNSAVLGVIEKLFALNAMTAVEAFNTNRFNAGSALTRAQSYRLISFRKYMWLIAALSMVVFGILLIGAFIALQFGIFLSLAAALVGVVAAICFLYFFAAFFYGLGYETAYFFGSCRSELDFSCYTFTRYVTFRDVADCLRTAFSPLGRMISEFWRNTLDRARDNFTDGMSRPLYSLYRWLQLISPATLVLWAGVWTLLGCIFLPILLFFMWLGLLLFTCVIKIFVH